MGLFPRSLAEPATEGLFGGGVCMSHDAKQFKKVRDTSANLGKNKILCSQEDSS